MPTITRRDPATGRFISADTFARLSALTTPEVVAKPSTGKKKAAKKKTKARKDGKRSAKSGKKKSAKKGKKKR